MRARTRSPNGSLSTTSKRASKAAAAADVADRGRYGERASERRNAGETNAGTFDGGGRFTTGNPERSSSGGGGHETFGSRRSRLNNSRVVLALQPPPRSLEYNGAVRVGPGSFGVRPSRLARDRRSREFRVGKRFGSALAQLTTTLLGHTLITSLLLPYPTLPYTTPSASPAKTPSIVYVRRIFRCEGFEI